MKSAKGGAYVIRACEGLFGLIRLVIRKMGPDLESIPVCTRCRRLIPAEDINVAKDVAFCRHCNRVTRLSSLVSLDGDEVAYDPHQPPDGVWIHRGPVETLLGATHRSLPTALGALAFGAFWNGILSIFILVALQSTLRHLGWSLPEWFPAPEIQNGQMGVGMTLFLWVFLLPFIGVGLSMVFAFVGALMGKTEVRWGERSASIFHGIGPLGWRRRFLPQEVSSIRLGNRKRRDYDGVDGACEIVMLTRRGREIRFGSSLREDRLRFLAEALRRQLPPRG